MQTCAGTAVSGVAITVKQSGSTIGTCTTDSSGDCCVDVTSTGTGSYDIKGTKSTFSDGNKTVSVTCPGTTNVSLKMDSGSAKRTVQVVGCFGIGIPGATLTVDGGTWTADGTGTIVYSLPTGTFPWTISSPLPARLNDVTGTITRGTCTGGSGYPANPTTLSVKSGYHCGCVTWWQPLADTLHLTDSVYGTFTMNWNSSDGAWNTGTDSFTPTMRITLHQCCGCGTTDVGSAAFEYNTGGCALTGGLFTNNISHCPVPYSVGMPRSNITPITVTSTSPPPSYSLSATVDACKPCIAGNCADGSTGAYIYPDGTTITITE